MAPLTIVMSVPDEFRSRFFDDDALRRLASVGMLVLDPDPAHHASPESHAILADADVLITCWGTGGIDDLLDEMPNLQLIVHSGGSVHSIVGPAVLDRGVHVTSQADINAEPVSQFTLAMIILAAKKAFLAEHLYRADRQKPDFTAHGLDTAGLSGSTIGIIELSRISRRVIELLRPFNATIKIATRFLSDAEAETLGVQVADLAEVLSTSDVVTLHAASTPQTRHMLGAEEFALLKDGATFINTARGAICDEQALIDELRTGRIQAIIDVTDPEVPVADSPLWTLPNVELFPHYSGSMGRELFDLGRGAVRDVEHFAAKEPLDGEITPSDYARRA